METLAVSGEGARVFARCLMPFEQEAIFILPAHLEE
jgi:hypothetical protein